MYDSRKDKRRKRPSSRPPQDSGSGVGGYDPSLLSREDREISSYVDETGQHRTVVGVHDGEVFDPNAPIDEPKGQSFNLGVKSLNDLPVHRPSKLCAPDQHDLKPDGEPGDDIPGHQAMKCSRCQFGQIVPV